MFGAFRPSNHLLIGQVRYARKPFFLSNGQKQRVRKRLKEVDSVVDTLIASNVKFDGLDKAMSMKRESQMTPQEKYYVFTRDPKTHMKPITQVPHFTKAEHPRGFPIGYQDKAKQKL